MADEKHMANEDESTLRLWSQRGYKTPQAYIDAYCEKHAHRKRLSDKERTRLFREVLGLVSPDEIERIHEHAHQNYKWEKKNDEWEKKTG